MNLGPRLAKLEGPFPAEPSAAERVAGLRDIAGRLWRGGRAAEAVPAAPISARDGDQGRATHAGRVP